MCRGILVSMVEMSQVAQVSVQVTSVQKELANEGKRKENMMMLKSYVSKC